MPPTPPDAVCEALRVRPRQARTDRREGRPHRRRALRAAHRAPRRAQQRAPQGGRARVSTVVDQTRAEEIVATLTTAPFPVDPYPMYAELRSIAPVYRSESGMWFATTYEGAATVLRATVFGQGEGAAMIRLDPRYEHSAVLQAFSHMITFIDPPDHSRLRRLVSRVFSPRMIDRLRGYVHDTVDELLVPIEKNGGGDLVTEFGEHIPVTVVCELLGVPHEDHEQCRAWSEDIALATEPTTSDDDLARGSRPARVRRVLPRARRCEACAPGRRRDDAAHPGGGRRRHAERRGARLDGDRADRRRLRDHPQPHRQRHPHVAAQPRRARQAARRPRARPLGGGGVSPLRSPGADRRAALRARRHRARRRARPARGRWSVR